MPKDQAPKLKGTLCNVPIDVVDVCKTLPRLPDSNGIVIVKLKRKLEYRGHVHFESVRPNFIMRLQQYLKLNNSLYHDIEINLDNLPNFLINEKSQNSLLLNVLCNMKKYQSWLRKMIQAKKLKVIFSLNPLILLLQLCLIIAKVPKTVT